MPKVTLVNLKQEIEVPQRWLDAIVSKLAYYIGRESEEVDEPTLARLKAEADAEKWEAQNEEVDRGPINIRTNLSGYTR